MTTNKPTYYPTAPVSSQAEKHAFSSKERDVETGLSYFGARYYSSDLSIWLSVDPMANKYPSMSPYTYCANNPVKLVDPNGEDWYENENGKVIWNDNVTKQTKLPKGCTYIGADNQSIVNYYNMNVVGEHATQKGGFASVCDSRQYATVTTKTDISTVAVTKNDSKAKTSTNKYGKVFLGIKIIANAGTNSTNSADVRFFFAGKLSVKYGGSTYSKRFKDVQAPIISTYEQNQTTSVLIPAKDINISKSYGSISITGNWSSSTDCGTSLLTNILFYPKSLKHIY